MALSIFAGGIHDMVQRKDLITLSFMIPAACALHTTQLHTTHNMTSHILLSAMDILYYMTLDRMHRMWHL